MKLRKFKKSLLNGTAQKKYLKLLKDFKSPKILYVGPNLGIFQDPTILFLLQYTKENGGQVYILEPQMRWERHALMGSGGLERYGDELHGLRESGVQLKPVQYIRNTLEGLAKTKIKIKFDVVVGHYLTTFLMRQSRYSSMETKVFFDDFMKHLRKGGLLVLQESKEYAWGAKEWLKNLEHTADSEGYKKWKYTGLKDRTYIKTDWMVGGDFIHTKSLVDGVTTNLMDFISRFTSAPFVRLLDEDYESRIVDLLKNDKLVLSIAPRYRCEWMLVIKK